MGNQAAKMVQSIFEGENASSIPVQYGEKGILFINEGASETFKISLPQNFKAEAVRIIK